MTELAIKEIDADSKLVQEQIHQESIHHLTQWKSTQLNIGIMAAGYADRHTFINTMKGVDSSSDTQGFELITISKPVGHVHPQNSNVIFWEMPECVDLDRNEYISLLQIEKYDMLLVCQSDTSKFDENELWLAEQMKAKGKPVFFVKFRISTTDQGVETCSVVDVIDRLEFQIIEKINDEYVEIASEPHENFYMVSTSICERKKLDFNKLTMDLIHSLDSVKMEAFTFSIEPFSPDIIHKKHELLRQKTFHSAIVSTLCGIFTHIVPGLGLVVDLSFLVQEIRFYVTQFGLCEEGLKRIVDNSNNRVVYEDLLAIINKSSYASLILVKDIHALTSVLVKVLPIFAAASAVEAIKFFPLVGHIIHGSMSFLMTKYTLIKILDEVSKVALDLHQFIEDLNNNHDESNKVNS